MLKISRKSTSGLSLVYILIIIAVVVVLAVVALPRFLRQQEKTRRTQATEDIDTLGFALDIYADHNGTYPNTEQGLKALWEKPTTPPVPSNWQGPYVEKPILKDPWEKDYVYIFPGRHNKNDYDLLSYAKDGMIGGSRNNEDISNFTEED